MTRLQVEKTKVWEIALKLILDVNIKLRLEQLERNTVFPKL